MNFDSSYVCVGACVDCGVQAGATSGTLGELAKTIREEVEGLEEAMRLARIVTRLQVGVVGPSVFEFPVMSHRINVTYSESCTVLKPLCFCSIRSIAVGRKLNLFASYLSVIYLVLSSSTTVHLCLATSTNFWFACGRPVLQTQEVSLRANLVQAKQRRLVDGDMMLVPGITTSGWCF